MAVITKVPATFEDLLGVKEKAELINGRIVYFMPHGRRPALVAKRILLNLDPYVESLGVGEAHMDNVGYAIRPMMPSGRQSFNPDTSYFVGPLPANDMKFMEGPPTFAVEVRSENDYGRAAEIQMAEKRDDYFLAGTLAVWDVDPVAETIALYSVSDLVNPVIFRRGDIAHAEPAVPGWRVAVDELFR